MLAVFKREFKSYFTNPLGFTILAAMYFLLGLIFQSYFRMGMPVVESVVIDATSFIIFLIPVITMRLFSDERRQKTDQVLFTAPVRLISIVLGKFFAALSLYAIGFLPTLAYQMKMASYVDEINNYYYLYALVGVLLFGAALIAIGMFVSALTESPVTSTVFTLVVNVFILLSSQLAAFITVPTETKGVFATAWAWILQRIVDLLNGMDFLGKLENFRMQIFSFDNIIYFVSITVAFVFLTERILEKRRWS